MSSAVASTSANRLSSEALTATHNVHYALSPRIGVISSADVLSVLEANHLTDFADLLKPFEDSIENLTVRTSQLETRRCETFPLCFDSLDIFEPQAASTSNSTFFTPADIVEVQSQSQCNGLSASTAKRRQPRYSRPELLLDAISARVSARSKAVWEVRDTNRVSSKSHSRKVSSIGGNKESLQRFLSTGDEEDLESYKTSAVENLTPWFADTRSMVLSSRNVSEHETFGHPLAVMLVVSSTSSDPMNAFASLFEASSAQACKTFTHRPYIDPLVLRYYVLLHDVSSSGPDLSESIALLDNIKKTYGLHCCLLPINSAQRGQARPDGVSELYRKAFQNDRRSKRATDGDDTPPKVPAKEGQTVEMTEENGMSSVDEEKRDRWFQEQDTVIYGEALDEEDIRKIRSFVRDFAAQSLIPFLERCVSLWNEQLTATRKGLTGRLFGVASRKFFGSATMRGAGAGQVSPTFATLGYYPHSSIEAQTRRLADFAFMTRDYRLASAMYDLGRRDYANDKAIKYVAGANEMFGLSHLMMILNSNSPPIDVDSYLASAGHYYLLSPRQKGSALQLDSLRATLLYYEVYQGLSFYRSAPSALVRTATEGSGDAENDLEVAGAMLLEQAAIANLRQSDRPALRKCALHLVMAAHRYRSCGQKHLSHRCFQGAATFYQMLMRQSGASQVQLHQDGNVSKSEDAEKNERLSNYLAMYEPTKAVQWDLIQDHLEAELGQQASSEGQISQAVLHFYTLLHRQSQSIFSTLDESAAKHEASLQGFLNCCKYLDLDFLTLMKSNSRQAILPLVDKMRSRLRVTSSARSDEDQWKLLESQAGFSKEAIQGEQQWIARKGTVDEAFWVDIVLINPLNTRLDITKLTIQLQDEYGKTLNDGIAIVDVLDQMHFDPLEEKTVSMAVTVKAPCVIKCSNVCYRLSGQVLFEETLETKGRRLNETKAQRASLQPIYAENQAFTIQVEKAKGRLEANLKTEVTRLGLGEEKEAEIVIKNVGKVSLYNACVYVNRPDAIIDQTYHESTVGKDEVEISNDLMTDKAIAISLPEGGLEAGASTTWFVILRGSALGLLTLRILFVYEAEDEEVMKTQFQQSIRVDAIIDLSVQAAPSVSEDFLYHLRIDAINLTDPEEEDSVTITSLSFVGSTWKIEKNTKNNITPFTEMTHGSRETLSATLQNHSSSHALIDAFYTVQQLQNILTGKNIDKKLAPSKISINLSHLGTAEESTAISPFLFLARKEYRLSILQSAYPSIQSIKEIQHIFTLYEPGEVDVIAHWELNKSKRRGQAFIFGLTLGPLYDYFERLFIKNEQDKMIRSLYAEAEKEKAALWMDIRKSRLHMEEDPILFSFVIPEKVEVIPSLSKGNNGGNEERKVINVEFLVRNVSTMRSRDVVIQLDNSLPPPLLNKNATLHASYIGRLTFRMTMTPQSLIRIQVKASIHALGTVLLAPVNVRSVITGASTKETERPFSRWEHCTTPFQVIAASG